MPARLFILICLLLSGLWSGIAPLRAADLYTGEALILSGEERSDQLTLQALDEVLMRLSGITERSLVRELGLGASDLRLLVLSEQRIRRQRPGPGGESPIEEVRLQVDFDAQGVDRLLAANALPRLGRERPAVLLWLAVEADFDVLLEGGPELEYAIGEQARRLGLDVIRPLADLVDLADIEANDIRGGFLDSAEPSARRYGAGVIAMLDLRPLNEAWDARWSWRLDGRDDGVRAEVDDAASAAEVGLERVLQAIAARFALAAGTDPGGSLRMVVSGIVEEVQYAEVLRYLGSLGAVADLRVIAARGHEVEFELLLGSAGLEDALAIGSVLAVDGRRADGSLLVRLLQ